MQSKVSVRVSSIAVIIAVAMLLSPFGVVNASAKTKYLRSGDFDFDKSSWGTQKPELAYKNIMIFGIAEAVDSRITFNSISAKNKLTDVNLEDMADMYLTAQGINPEEGSYYSTQRDPKTNSVNQNFYRLTWFGEEDIFDFYLIRGASKYTYIIFQNVDDNEDIIADRIQRRVTDSCSYSVSKIFTLYKSGVDLAGNRVFGVVNKIASGYVVLKQGSQSIKIKVPDTKKYKVGTNYTFRVKTIKTVGKNTMIVNK